MIDQRLLRENPNLIKEGLKSRGMNVDLGPLQKLSKALKELEASNKEFFIFSATTFPSPIQRALFVDQDGFSKMFNPELKNTRSQDLEQAYHDAGQFYFASSKTWLKNTNIFDNGKPMILPRWRSQDIDTIEDWEMAEFIFTRLNK